VTRALVFAVIAVLMLLTVAETLLLGDRRSRDAIAPASRETPVEPRMAGHAARPGTGDDR
jgi:hypothetical protein